MESYAIGYQKNAQVTTAHKVNGHFVRVEDSSQVVDQVFCAALNIIQGLNGKRNGEVAGVETKCRFLLKCAYEGSYLSAIAHNRKKLYLTLIGAGSFGNRIEWIYDAILKAHFKWGRHPNNSLKKVIIVLYTGSSFNRPFVDELKNYNIAYNIINYKKGIPHLEEKFTPVKRKKGLTSSKSSDDLPSLFKDTSPGITAKKNRNKSYVDKKLERTLTDEIPRRAYTQRISSSSSSSPKRRKMSQKLIFFSDDDPPTQIDEIILNPEPIKTENPEPVKIENPEPVSEEQPALPPPTEVHPEPTPPQEQQQGQQQEQQLTEIQEQPIITDPGNNS